MMNEQHKEFPTPQAEQQPEQTTPTGPIWIVHGSAGARPFRVRQLPLAPGLLQLGITLRHSSVAGHPRLQPPTMWWRDKDKTWIAAPDCDGVTLDAKRRERPTWSQAVDAITPLASALRKAHRRGLIHGHLAPWNLYLDETKFRFSAVDFGTWPLEGLEAGPFCPPEMRNEKGARNPTPATDIHNLARILIYFALSPDEAQREKPNFETLPAYAISTLERAIRSKASDRPQTIDEFLSGLTFHSDGPRLTPTATGTATVAGRVRNLETFDHDKNGPGIRFHLATPDQDDSPGVFVYEKQQPAVFNSLRLLWDGAELNLEQPRSIEDSAGRTFLTATDRTLPVIQPHWPVSVSNVLKARGCPQRVMVDHRDPGERTHHLAFGNLVHGFLEDLVANDDLTFEDAVDARLPDLRLDFLASGIDDAELSKLVQQARSHFEHLRRFTSRRTAEASHHDRVGWCGEHAEATRYSTQYGLEGRTDLVVNDADEGLQIIELKSGKPWHDHPGQVQSYALLWRELADRKDLPTTGHLLYSKTGRMKEVPLDGDDEKEELIHGRNGLVALFRSYVDTGFDYKAPYYMEQPQLCRQNACRFRRDRCRAQTELLGLREKDSTAVKAWSGIEKDLVRRARRYHGHLTRLVEMERWTDHAALGAIFQPYRLAERIADGMAAADLTLAAHSDSDDGALLSGKGLHVFSPGDRILIHRGDIDGHHVLRARVDGRASDGNHLEIRLRAAELATEFTGPGWIADVMPSRIGYRTAHRALFRILENHRPDRLDVLLRPHQQPADSEVDATIKVDAATEALLNDSQLDALRRGLQGGPATLVQGPPGTGKTTVIAHLCAELASRNLSVLLSALTNTAVDTMLVKLLDAADARGDLPPPFLRLGPAKRSPMLVEALLSRDLNPANYFADDLSRQTTSLASLSSQLRGTLVVATTAHSALRHPAMTYFERQSKGHAFDVALIDEASQLTEPMALAPISTARRFVLVGDHRQLPPIVTGERALTTFLLTKDQTSDDDKEAATEAMPIAQSLLDAGLGGLDRSLFERLAKFLPPRMLTVQYRMHRDIMEFPARSFYDDRLRAHESIADHKLTYNTDASVPPLQTEAPVVFVDIDGSEIGRTNPDEARAVLETAADLINSSPTSTVGILSPFRAQVHLLRQLQSEFDLPRPLDIDTVERFQGNERDVILATVVKTDHPGDFLADPRRLNVALTRARKKLIIFGRRSCLEQDPTFRQWLSSPETTVVSWTASE